MPDSWPADLPQEINIEAYSETFADGLIETTPDAGPPQTRLRSSAVPRTVSGTMVLSAAQVASLRTFVRVTLLGGALPFNFPAQIEDEIWLVKFPKGGLPKIGAMGGDSYSLSLNLMILP